MVELARYFVTFAEESMLLGYDATQWSWYGWLARFMRFVVVCNNPEKLKGIEKTRQDGSFFKFITEEIGGTFARYVFVDGAVVLLL